MPKDSGKLVGKRDGGDLGRSPGQQCREPGAVFGAVDLGIADDGECTGHEQAAQIAVTLFADAAEPVLAPPRVLLRPNGGSVINISSTASAGEPTAAIYSRTKGPGR